MAKFQEAFDRLFKNFQVCRKCKSRIKAAKSKVLAGKVRCRVCHSKQLKPVRMK
jgi:ribosomal protein L40E